ncbi:MAG: DEAD/DEAH box helicase [Pseudomonadales bacterium]|nr:DEAD/DEAH box helicase [Pseudomonadales bacterium]
MPQSPSFSELGLSDSLLKAVSEQGYESPTDIQAQVIPSVLQGRDVIAAAQTGTGKTASFVLPMLEKFNNTEAVRPKRIKALILVPTRELADQVANNIRNYAAHSSITTMAMVGGVDMEPQKQGLIEGVDILVATPGRLLDMAHQRAVYFDELEILVLDEADRMLDMGFIADINKIIERLPEQRQNLLFSATLSDEVRSLAKTTIMDAVEVTLAADEHSKTDISQWLVTVDKDRKSALLSHLIQDNHWQQALIFIKTKHGAAKLVSQLQKRGIKADSIHGDRSQAVRTQILADFKSGELPFLVATGVAARGIDIDALERVVNYDLPIEADDYIHRIGRTGRAGATGEAISLLSYDDFRNLCAIESRLGHIIERREFEEFVVRKEVPISILNFQPKNKRAALPMDAYGKVGRGAVQGEKNQSSKNKRKSSANPKRNNSGSDEGQKPNPWGNWQGGK